jgi:hypothetical protein
MKEDGARDLVVADAAMLIMRMQGFGEKLKDNIKKEKSR